MKLIFLSREALFPTIGGHREFLFSTLKQLAEANNEVTLISWGPEESYTYSNNLLKEYHVRTHNSLQVVEEKKFSLITETILSQLGAAQLKTIFHKGLNKLPPLDYSSYDLIIKSGPDSNNLSHILAKSYDVPILERVDWVGIPYTNECYEKWLKYSDFSLFSLKRLSRSVDLLVTKLEANTMKQDRYIYTFSKRDKAKLTRFLPKAQINFIYPFLSQNDYLNTTLDSEKITLKLPENFVLFYASPSFDSEMAQIYINKIAKKMPNINFVITGLNNTQIKRNNNVLNLGKIKLNAFLEILSLANFVILPLARSHGIQMKLIRAFSLGKTVLTTSALIHPLNEIVADMHNVVIRDDPNEFASTIPYLYDNSGITNNIGKNSYKTYEENFSPRSHLKNISTYFESIIRNS